MVAALSWSVLTSVVAAADRPAGPEEAVVLNEQAYVRQYRVFGLERLASRPLKAEADRFFPKRAGRSVELLRLERTTKKLLAGRGIDWKKTDWRDVAVYLRGYRSVYCIAGDGAE